METPPFVIITPVGGYVNENKNNTCKKRLSSNKFYNTVHEMLRLVPLGVYTCICICVYAI